MQSRWWERPAAILNDYWSLFLTSIILIIALILTHTSWMPLLGLNITSRIPSIPQIDIPDIDIPDISETMLTVIAPEATFRESTEAAETSTHAMEVTRQGKTPDIRLSLTLVPQEWKEYHDPDWNFSLEQPSRGQTNPLELIREIQEIVDGSQEMLFSVDSPLANSQDRSPDETIRIQVIRYGGKDQPFNEWAVQVSVSYVETLEQDEPAGTCPSLRGTAINQDGKKIFVRFIDVNGVYYGIIIKDSSDGEIAKRIADSFSNEDCEN